MFAAGAAVTAAGFATVYASDDVVHPAKQDWDFNGYMSTYDAARCAQKIARGAPKISRTRRTASPPASAGEMQRMVGSLLLVGGR